jgi:predicted secreted protein
MPLHRVLMSARSATVALLFLSLLLLPGCLNDSSTPSAGSPGAYGKNPSGGGGGGGGGSTPDGSPAVIEMDAGAKSDEVRSIQLRPGQTLYLRLATARGNTAMWRLSPASTTALQAGSQPITVSQRKIEQTTSPQGIVTEHTFRIKGVRPGAIAIEFLYDRATSPSLPPIRKFGLNVTVGS